MPHHIDVMIIGTTAAQHMKQMRWRSATTQSDTDINPSIKLKRSCIVMFNDFKEMVGKLSHASGNLEYVSSLCTHSFMFVGCEERFFYGLCNSDDRKQKKSKGKNKLSEYNVKEKNHNHIIGSKISKQM
ncbi:hypothetical protein GQX74_003550 [Glossina fuscipes]|nr:hypothetical protein GQX74_003550 [Glossina fuscipes]